MRIRRGNQMLNEPSTAVKSFSGQSRDVKADCPE